MKKFGIKCKLILLVIFLVWGLKMPSQAAKKPKVTQIRTNMTTKVQLDGKGAKEKVKLTVNDSSDFEYGCTRTVTLEINGKEIYKNSFASESEWSSVKVEAIVTDVQKKDVKKDLFLAVYNHEWSGTYQELLRVTYQNGKVLVENVLDMLKAIKSPRTNEKWQDMSGRGYMLNPIESCQGLTKDLVVSGDGTMKWHVCLYSGSADYLHGYVILKLKANKLKIGNYPSGIITETGYSGKLKGNMTLYKSAGSTKKVITAAKGNQIQCIEFKFIRKKLYVKVQYGKKKGWVSQSGLKALECNGSLHI